MTYLRSIEHIVVLINPLIVSEQPQQVPFVGLEHGDAFDRVPIVAVHRARRDGHVLLGSLDLIMHEHPRGAFDRFKLMSCSRGIHCICGMHYIPGTYITCITHNTQIIYNT